MPEVNFHTFLGDSRVREILDSLLFSIHSPDEWEAYQGKKHSCVIKIVELGTYTPEGVSINYRYHRYSDESFVPSTAVTTWYETHLDSYLVAGLTRGRALETIVNLIH